MSLVARMYRDIEREVDGPRHAFGLWDEPRGWWPRDQLLLRPMDELVRRRVRNQLIASSPLEWSYPLRWRNHYAGERVLVDERGFRVDIDVRQFRPHEVLVRTTDDCVVVQGNHKRRSDGHGLVERHFVRKYLLPRGFSANDVVTSLSADGVLTIRAPPPPPARCDGPHERLIRIHETGQPSLAWR